MRQRVATSGVRVHQWGDEEATFVLTPAEAEPWLAALGFYKRRELSPEQREAAASRLAAVNRRELTPESTGADEA